jgi:hypothetical protein
LGNGSHPADTQDAALAFDPDNYSTITVTVDGQPTTVRWYKEICDVANPVAAAAQQTGIFGTVTISNTRCGYESMNVFVPQPAVDNQRTPIYFEVNNAGWMASNIGQSVTDGGFLRQLHLASRSPEAHPRAAGPWRPRTGDDPTP